jgi:membrane protein required for colicin V production
MPVLDWIFVVVLLASLALGAWRGLVYEVLSAVNWIAAFILAQWLALDVAQKLPLSGSSEAIRYLAGFALVFVVSVLAGSLLAKLAQKIFAAIGLQPADRALGAAFGLVRGVVLILVATVVIAMTPVRSSEWWTQSVGAGISMAALKGLQPVLPEEFGRYLPS